MGDMNELGQYGPYGRRKKRRNSEDSPFFDTIKQFKYANNDPSKKGALGDNSNVRPEILGPRKREFESYEKEEFDGQVKMQKLSDDAPFDGEGLSRRENAKNFGLTNNYDKFELEMGELLDKQHDPSNGVGMGTGIKECAIPSDYSVFQRFAEISRGNDPLNELMMCNEKKNSMALILYSKNEFAPRNLPPPEKSENKDDPYEQFARENWPLYRHYIAEQHLDIHPFFPGQLMEIDVDNSQEMEVDQYFTEKRAHSP